MSSATLDATKFLDYFSNGISHGARIVSLEGRMYPVEVAYLREPTHDYVQKAAEVAWNINLKVCPGELWILSYSDEKAARPWRHSYIFDWAGRD